MSNKDLVAARSKFYRTRTKLRWTQNLVSWWTGSTIVSAVRKLVPKPAQDEITEALILRQEALTYDLKCLRQRIVQCKRDSSRPGGDHSE